MQRFWKLAAGALALAASPISPLAHAAEHHVLNGSSLGYALSGGNGYLTIQYGTVDILGVSYPVPGGGAGAVPYIYDAANCTTQNSPPTLPANAILYAYFHTPAGTCYSNGAGLITVSTIPPWTDAYPQSPIHYISNSGCSNQACATDQSGFTYLGSFLTDSAAQIIPFVRNGDEVLLHPKANASGCNSWANCDPIGFTQLGAMKGATNANPLTQVISLGSIPASASAAIIDVDISVPQNTFAGIMLLDPHFTTGIPAGCNSVPMADFFGIGNSVGTGTYMEYRHLRVGVDSTGAFTAGSCDSPAAGISWSFALRGYVEDVNAPGRL